MSPTAAEANRARVELDQDREVGTRIARDILLDRESKPAPDEWHRCVQDEIARRDWVISKFDSSRLKRLAELAKDELAILCGQKTRVVVSETRPRTPLVPTSELPPELRPGLRRKTVPPLRLEEPAAPKRTPPPARSIPAGPAPVPKQTPKEEIVARLDGKKGPTAAEWMATETRTLIVEGWEGPRLAAEVVRRAFDAGVVSGKLDGVWYNHARTVMTDLEVDIAGFGIGTLRRMLEEGIEDPTAVDDVAQEEEEDPDLERAQAARTADLDARVENAARARARSDVHPIGVLAAVEGVTVAELEERQAMKAPPLTELFGETKPFILETAELVREALTATEAIRRYEIGPISKNGPQPGPPPEPPVDKLFLSGEWGEFTVLQIPGDPDADVHVALHGRLPPAAADQVAAIVLASRYPRASPL